MARIAYADFRLLTRALSFIRPYWREAALCVGLLALIAATQAAGPALIALAIDGPIAARKLSGLLWIGGAYLLVALCGYQLQVRQALQVQLLGQKIMQDMRSRIFRHLQKMHLGFYDGNPSGRLLTRVIGDVEVIQELFTSGLVAVFGDFFALGSIAIAMLLMDAKLALVPLGLMPFVILATAVYKRYARPSYRLIRNYLSHLNGALSENVNGMATVQLFGREARNFEKFNRIHTSYKEQVLLSIRYNSIFYPTIQLIYAAAIAGVIVYGGGRILTGAAAVGVVVAFIQYVQRFFQPIQDLAEKYNIYQAALASSERIFQLLDTEPAIGAPASSQIWQPEGRIEFRNVSFSYQASEPVLEDVSFRVEPGERVAILGETGAGKTSLANVLMRFYDFEQGEVLLDGMDIRDLNPHEIRRNIAFVPQDVFLFSGSLAENISLGRASRAEAEQAVCALGMESLVRRFPKGLEERAGERGCTLSLGERQLIALARAMALNPAILLLDEATSSVDTETEALIQKALVKLMEGRTCLIIAHRLSTLQMVHRVLRVRERQVVSQRPKEISESIFSS